MLLVDLIRTFGEDDSSFQPKQFPALRLVPTLTYTGVKLDQNIGRDLRLLSKQRGHMAYLGCLCSNPP